MPQYELYILCPICRDFHDALARVTLDDAFDVRRVSDVYQEAVPLEFHQAIAQIHCSLTNEPVEQGSPDVMVLVAVGKWSGESKPQIRELAQEVTQVTHLPKKSLRNPTS